MWLLVSVDVEATGRSPSRDRITQIAAVAASLDDLRCLSSSFNEFVYTPKPLSVRVQAFNGITRPMLRHADTAPEVLRRWEAWIVSLLDEHAAEGVVLAAHNGARLDYPLLFLHYTLLARTDPCPLLTARLPPERLLLLDTLPLLRALAPRVEVLRRVPSFALDQLHTHLLGTPHQAHDALHDAGALLSVLARVRADGGSEALGGELLRTHAEPCATLVARWRTRTAADAATEAEESRRKREQSEATERLALERHALRRAKERSTMQDKSKKKGKTKNKTTKTKTKESKNESAPCTPQRCEPLPPAAAVFWSPQEGAAGVSSSSPPPACRSLSDAFEGLDVSDDDDVAWEVGSASDREEEDGGN